MVGQGLHRVDQRHQGTTSLPGPLPTHVPGELGYYDLRVPEVREARPSWPGSTACPGSSTTTTGSTAGGCWSDRSRRCWPRARPTSLRPVLANEEWTRNWDGQSGRLLIPQEHSDQDDLDHIRWLCEAFSDDRYIKIDGRPLMLVYRPLLLPNARRTTDLWRAEAQRLGSRTSICPGSKAGAGHPKDRRRSGSTPPWASCLPPPNGCSRRWTASAATRCWTTYPPTRAC